MTAFVDLDEPEADNPAIVGGKAAHLGRLRAAGFPVPEGVVIQIRPFVEHIGRRRGPQGQQSRSRDTIPPTAKELTPVAMIDFVKKIHKHCAADLEPGEQVLAATFGQPPGAIRRQVAWGAVGGAVGAIAGEALANKRLKDSEQTTGEGMTVEIPAGKAVLALSAQRLLVFGHSALSGRPKGLNASIPLDQIQSIDVDLGKLTGKMLITFVDGTSVDFDMVKTSGPGPFAEKFTELTGR